MTYIESFAQEGAKRGECFICTAVNSGDLRNTYTLEKRERVIIMLNIFPYNPGHLLVAPTRHLSQLSQLEDKENASLLESVGYWVERLKTQLKPDGFNIGINLGSVAGAGLPEHLHVHIVPRWSGDTNFMPVISSVKVMPELLASTYDRLLLSSRKSDEHSRIR
jgi:ATP adenylyltransferase